MTVPRIAVLALVTTLGASALGWLSRAPYDPPGGATGVLRLSWRLRGEKEEHCRKRTPAELEALPIHMRTPEVCEGRLVAYRLAVRIDDEPAAETLVAPAGARGDRPIYVLREVPLPPGPHRVRVRFARATSAHADRHTALELDTRIEAEPGAIELITIDPETGRLVRRAEAHAPASPDPEH